MHVCSCLLGSYLFRECAFCVLPSILKYICMRRQHLSHIPYTLHLKASLRQKLCIMHRTASHHYRKLPFAILIKALTTVLTPRPRVSCRYLSKITDFVKDKGKAEPWVTILKPGLWGANTNRWWISYAQGISCCWESMLQCPIVLRTWVYISIILCLYSSEEKNWRFVLLSLSMRTGWSLRLLKMARDFDLWSHYQQGFQKQY